MLALANKALPISNPNKKRLVFRRTSPLKANLQKKRLEIVFIVLLLYKLKLNQNTVTLSDYIILKVDKKC